MFSDNELINRIERSKDSGDIYFIIGALSHDNDHVKRAAIIALGSIRDEKALGPLADLLRKEYTKPGVLNDELLYDIVEAIGNMPSIAGLDALIKFREVVRDEDTIRGQDLDLSDYFGYLSGGYRLVSHRLFIFINERISVFIRELPSRQVVADDERMAAKYMPAIESHIETSAQPASAASNDYKMPDGHKIGRAAVFGIAFVCLIVIVGAATASNVLSGAPALVGGWLGLHTPQPGNATLNLTAGTDMSKAITNTTDRLHASTSTHGPYVTATTAPTTTPTPTVTPSPLPTAIPTSTLTPTTNITPTPTSTATPTPTPVPTATYTPTPTLAPTPTPTPIPTIKPTAVPTLKPMPTITSTPMATVTPTPTPIPSVTPTATPTATSLPTETPTPGPTQEPGPTPSD